ncbi:MAG: anaerobic ribonucleoside-triphosphate reductase activating protein, partial [Anaeroplasmataceae bacterium]|nr:anaerobic ribonucleoside-triphosphate reductase activating protein [Anaeroplasmataceae bacterium]
MNYATIKKYDIANGLGVRVSLFVSGCTHHCKNCFNAVAWDFNYGSLFTKDVEDEIIAALKQPMITGLSLLGGEPMEPQNQIGLYDFLKRVKKEVPHKDIWCYTGYTLETELLEGRAHIEIT